MKQIRPGLLMACLACSLATAQVRENTVCNSLVDKALEVTGVTDYLQQIPEQVRSQAPQLQNNFHLGPRDTQVVTRAMMRTFGPMGLRRGLKQAYLTDCDPEMLQNVITRLDTALGQRMRKLEAFAGTVEGIRQIPAYHRELLMHPASDARYRLVKRLDQLTGMSELSLEAVLSISKGIRTAVGRSALTEAEISSLRAQTLPYIRADQTLVGLFAYRNVDDEDLKQYVAIYEIPALQQFYRTLKSGLVDTLEKQSRQAALDVKK